MGGATRYKYVLLHFLGADLVFESSSGFSQDQDVKGSVLGIAQYVGDAFCFLILTQPESDSDNSPQILARSIIRQRYTSDETPVVERTSSSPTLFTIYKSDGVTPLDDWVPSSNAEDQVGDLISQTVGEFDLPTTLSAQNGHLSDVLKGMTDEKLSSPALSRFMVPSPNDRVLNTFLICLTILHTHWASLLRFVMPKILRFVLPTASQLFPNYTLLCPTRLLWREACVRT